MAPFSVNELTNILARLLPDPHAGLLAGLLFGTKATLPKELYNQLVSTGTIHIIALSGMNITILINLVANTIHSFVGKKVASVFTIGVIVWFVWFVGPSATIIRAAIMGSLTLIALVFGRQQWALLSLALAVGGMLVLNFSWLFDISFQLSVLATLGIILFGKTMKTHGNGGFFIKAREEVFYFLKQNFQLTLAAQVFTVPLIFFHFHRLSLIAPITNVAIAWVIPLVTTLGWVASIAGWIYLPLGFLPAWMSWVLLEYLVRTVQTLSRVPFASVGL